MVTASLANVIDISPLEAASSKDFFWALPQKDVARELKNS